MRCTVSLIARAALLLALPLAAVAGCAARPHIQPDVQGDQQAIAAQMYVNEGDRAFEEKKYDTAVEKYQIALETYSNLPHGWYNLGLAYVTRKGPEDLMKGAECFKVAAGLNPANWEALARVGAIYHELGYLDDAAKYYDQALERDPNAWGALWNSILVDDLRDVRTEQTADRIRRALLHTDNEQQREYLKRQKEKVDTRLNQRAPALGTPAATPPPAAPVPNVAPQQPAPGQPGANLPNTPMLPS
ncbi:hypothetical protein BH11PLA1_BH11PLA1_20170 [soil metagenome]